MKKELNNKRTKVGKNIGILIGYHLLNIKNFAKRYNMSYEEVLTYYVENIKKALDHAVFFEDKDETEAQA